MAKIRTGEQDYVDTPVSYVTPYAVENISLDRSYEGYRPKRSTPIENLIAPIAANITAQDIATQWQNSAAYRANERIGSYQRLPAKNQPTSDRASTSSWIVDELANADSNLRGVFDSQGKLQAAYQIDSSPIYDETHIEYLASAPWNQFQNDPNRVKGAGTAAITDAAIQSRLDPSSKGGVSLFAATDAVPFYEKLGFKAQDKGGYKLPSKTADNMIANALAQPNVRPYAQQPDLMRSLLPKNLSDFQTQVLSSLPDYSAKSEPKLLAPAKETIMPRATQGETLNAGIAGSPTDAIVSLFGKAKNYLGSLFSGNPLSPIESPISAPTNDLYAGAGGKSKKSTEPKVPLTAEEKAAEAAAKNQAIIDTGVSQFRANKSDLFDASGNYVGATAPREYPASAIASQTGTGFTPRNHQMLDASYGTDAQISARMTERYGWIENHANNILAGTVTPPIAMTKPDAVNQKDTAFTNDLISQYGSDSITSKRFLQTNPATGEIGLDRAIAPNLNGTPTEYLPRAGEVQMLTTYGQGRQLYPDNVSAYMPEGDVYSRMTQALQQGRAQNFQQTMQSLNPASETGGALTRTNQGAIADTYKPVNAEVVGGDLAATRSGMTSGYQTVDVSAKPVEGFKLGSKANAIDGLNIGMNATFAAGMIGDSLQQGNDLSSSARDTAFNIGGGELLASAASKIPAPAPVKAALTIGGFLVGSIAGDSLNNALFGNEQQRAKNAAITEQNITAGVQSADDATKFNMPIGKTGIDAIDLPNQISASLVDSINPVKQGYSLGTGLGVLDPQAQDAAANARFATARTSSMQANIDFSGQNDYNQRILNLQNLANEQGNQVTRNPSQLGGDTFSALTGSGYSQQQISNYLTSPDRSANLVLGNPQDTMFSHVADFAQQAIASAPNYQDSLFSGASALASAFLPKADSNTADLVQSAYAGASQAFSSSDSTGLGALFGGTAKYLKGVN